MMANTKCEIKCTGSEQVLSAFAAIETAAEDQEWMAELHAASCRELADSVKELLVASRAAVDANNHLDTVSKKHEGLCRKGRFLAKELGKEIPYPASELGETELLELMAKLFGKDGTGAQ
jgi:hypothetical protein